MLFSIYISIYEKLTGKYNVRFDSFQIEYLLKNKFNILNNLNSRKSQKFIIDLFFLFFYRHHKLNRNTRYILEKYLIILKNSIYLRLFEKINIDFENHNLYINDLKRLKLFYEIVDYIFLDQNFLNNNYLIASEISRNKIIRLMNNDFKKLYALLQGEVKIKIKKILMNNLDFSKYFNLDLLGFNHIYLFTQYDRKYKIFLLFSILKNEINEENFFKNLENNYGIYSDAEDFIEEINNEYKRNKNKFLKEIFHKYPDLDDIKELIILYYCLEESDYSMYSYIYHNNTYSDYIMEKNINKLSFFKELKDNLIEVNILMREENEACLRHKRSYIKLKKKFMKEENNDNKIKKKIKTKKKKIKKSIHKIHTNGYKKNYR